MRIGMSRHRSDPLMADPTTGRFSPFVTILTMCGAPTGRMGVGVSLCQRVAMADGTLSGIRGARVTRGAMLFRPPAPMRARMIRNGGPALMAHPALLRLGARMTLVAMLLAPPGQMGIGMGADFRFMTQRTAGAITFAGMAIITVITIPPRTM